METPDAAKKIIVQIILIGIYFDLITFGRPCKVHDSIGSIAFLV